ncbi:MAG TPA: GGDEF domain-containing protein, partial [Candidatus Limnocylindrales bacterium]
MPRPRASRHQRYLVAIGGVIGVAMLVVGVVFAATEAQRAEIDRESVAAGHIRELSLGVADSVRDQEADVHDYLLTRATAQREAYEAAANAEKRLASDLRVAATEAPGLEVVLGELESFSATWQTGFAVPAIDAVDAGGSIDEFVRVAADDHEAVDGAIEPLETQLAELDSDIGRRSASVDEVRVAATGVGLVGMLAAAVAAGWLLRRYGQVLELDAIHAGIVNRFTEVTSFAPDDTSIASSNLEALTLLVRPDAGVTHVLNRSKDRAVPEATVGHAIADVLPLGELSHCPGLVRGGMYVVDDASQPLSVHCPVYPVRSGTLACVPLASGETVGAVHLHWERPNALPLEVRASVLRVAEHAALGIGNRRLLAALQGQANTDARTGLANSRAFDEALEEALETRRSEDSLAVLMLDLDRFRDFNDRYGHPGGDEALRAFATVLRSCVRESDLAARYGGEEFAVLMPGIGEEAAAAVAERIRTRTESTVVA